MATAGRVIIPGNCDRCNATINPGVDDFYVLKCHLHLVCALCHTTFKIKRGSMCNYCTSIGSTLSVSGNTKCATATGETYLLRSDYKMIEPGTERASIISGRIPTGITFAKTVNMLGDEIFTLHSCWPSPITDQLVVGNNSNPENNYTISVINADLTNVSHEMHGVDQIASGVCINAELSLICDYKAVYSVKLDITAKMPTQLHIFHRLEATDPACVFQYSKNKFGVLCMDPSRFDVFWLRDIFIEEVAQSVDTIQLNYRDPHLLDRVCMDKETNIYVSSHENHTVFIFDVTGTLVRKIGKVRESGIVEPGRLFYPVDIQCFNDGHLLVTGWRADVHTYDGNNWAVLNQTETDDYEGEYVSGGKSTDSFYWSMFCSVWGPRCGVGVYAHKI